MLSFVLFLLLAAIIAASIWLLFKNQRRRTLETADRTAPLPVLDNSKLPDFSYAATPAPTSPAPASPGPAPVSVEVNADSWLGQIRALRDLQQFDKALLLCQEYYPRIQAFQQTALILRQQIRFNLEQGETPDILLQDLFRTAALADLFRSGNPLKPENPRAVLQALHATTFHYSSIGHKQLKLLNKSDVRIMEQLWGSPATHRHVDEVLGKEWLALCGTGKGARS